MTPSFAVTAGLAASLLLAAPALAVDIENADAESHEISIADDSSEASNFELSPGERHSDICAMRCTVTVSGIGSIVADTDETVVIRDGRLSKRLKQL